MQSVQSSVYTQTPASISNLNPIRPLGITTLALLLSVQAIFEIVVGFFAFFGNIIHNPLSGLLVGWIPLAIGVLLFILAWGLWTIKLWAYWVTLILEIVNIVLHFLGYSQTHSIFAIISGGIISIIIVIYLLVDGNVRRAFRTGI